MLDALIRLLCRRPPQCAEVLWQTGWLLRQLLPFQEHKISDSRMSLLDRAYSAGQKDLALELTDCWFDLIPAVLSEEWNVCRKGNYSISLSLSAGDPKGLHYWIPILDLWFAGFIIPVHFFQQYH
jgi:hypothetical protein